MATVGSVGYALASAIAKAEPTTTEYVVVINVPELDPPVRVSKPMSRAAADSYAGELRAEGTLLGAPICAVDVAPKPETPSDEVLRQRIKARSYANAPAFMPNNRRKVRASDKDWRGEKDGPKIDRTTERITHVIPGGFRKGWVM